MLAILWAFSKSQFFSLMEGLKHDENYQNVTRRQETGERYWKNGTHRLAQLRVPQTFNL